MASIENRVQKLDQERGELADAVARADERAEEIGRKLEELWARSERGGDSKAAKAAAKAEEELGASRRERNRKAAALRVCEAELEAAHEELRLVVRKRAWQEIREAVATVEEIVKELEGDPLAPTLWAELKRNQIQIERVYRTQLYGGERGEIKSIMDSVDGLPGRLLSENKGAIEGMMRNGTRKEARSLSELMNFDRVRARLKAVRPE